MGIQTRLGSRPEANTEIDADSDEEVAGYVNAVDVRGSQPTDEVRKRRRANGVASTRYRENGRFVSAPSIQPRVEEVEEDDDVMMDCMPQAQTQESSQTQQGQHQQDNVPARARGRRTEGAPK